MKEERDVRKFFKTFMTYANIIFYIADKMYYEIYFHTEGLDFGFFFFF